MVYVTGDDNQLLSDGVYRYVYDAEGNVTARYVDQDASETLNSGDTDVTEYTWDYRNRLTDAVHRNSFGGAANWTADYTYDVFDRRIASRYDEDGDATLDREEQYVWKDGNVVLDFVDPDGGNNGGASAPLDLATRYVWGPAVDLLLAQENVDDGGPEDVLWPVTDNQGSVRSLVDSSGSVVSTFSYGSFGDVTVVQGDLSDTRYLYTAQEYDALTAQYYYNARWYNPKTGRFLSVDPLSFAAGDANLYRYVGNSPTNFTDPTGFEKGAAHGAADALEAFPLNGTPEQIQDFIDSMSDDPTVFQEQYDSLSPEAQDAIDEHLGIREYQPAPAGPVEQGFLDAFWDAIKAPLASEGLDSVPIISTLKGLQEAFTGKNYVTGEELGPGGRALSALNAVPGGKIIEKVAEGAAAIGKGAQNFVEALTGALKKADGAPSAKARADEIHGVLDPRAQRARTTAVTETAEGTRIVSSSEPRLSPSQRAKLGPNEIEGVGKGHAEVTGVQTALDKGLTPTGTAASRPICPDCANTLNNAGVSTLSPLK